MLFRSGVVFAPTPRSYACKVNKKVAKLALKCAYSSKVREQQLIVLNDLVLDDFKTKSLVKVLSNFKVENNKVIVLLKEENGNVELAGRNLINVLVEEYTRASVYQIMNADTIVATKEAIQQVEEVLK